MKPTKSVHPRINPRLYSTPTVVLPLCSNIIEVEISPSRVPSPATAPPVVSDECVPRNVRPAPRRYDFFASRLSSVYHVRFTCLGKFLFDFFLCITNRKNPFFRFVISYNFRFFINFILFIKRCIAFVPDTSEPTAGRHTYVAIRLLFAKTSFLVSSVVSSFVNYINIIIIITASWSNFHIK